jgi:hypothetical protein
MPLNGDVKTFPIPAIVRMIHEERKTGNLTVAGANRRCRIYFKEGKIVFTTGNTDKQLRLGALLVANKLITEEKLEEMLGVAKAMEKRLGAVLIEREYITHDDLARVLVHQFKEVITNTLSWNEAKFSYVDGLDGYVEDVRFELDPTRLMSEAKRWQDFRGLIPNDQVVFLLKPGAMGSKSIHAARELRILLLLDGKRSVAQLIEETGYTKLAVYRALSKLFAQNVITRKESVKRPAAKKEVLQPRTIISLYRSLIELVKDDIAAEIGSKQAAAAVESSLKGSIYYDIFLSKFRLDQSLTTNIGHIQMQLRQQQGDVSQRDFIKGFNQVIARMIREQYRFLGIKATRNTLKKVRDALENVPDDQRLLAKTLSRFLEQYMSEEFLSGQKKVASTLVVEQDGRPGVSLAPINLETLGGSAIVAFYNDMFQVVIEDLESEIGAKARSLFQSIIRSSHYYDAFLSRFDLQSTSGSNASRIKQHIETQQLKMSKKELATAFQQVLAALMQEESRLLGPKSTDVTRARLVERMAVAEPEFKPLVEHLSAYLVSNTAQAGSGVRH